jgi:hypothetical protein
MLDQSGNTSGATINNSTRLVGPITVGGTNVGTLRINNVALSDGQVFSVNGKAIRISAQDPASGTVQDGTAANPVYVKTVGDLLSQLRGALTGGADTSSTTANFNTLTTVGNRITLTGSGSGSNGQITFSQLAGPQVDITKIFSGTRKNQTNPTANYTEDQAGQVSAAASGYQTFTVGAVDHTITGGTNGQTPDPRRAAAAKSYKLAIDQIGQYLKSASVSGINLLNGDSLKVTFDEKGSNTTFQLQDAANNALTFSAASLGLVNAQTGASSDVANNFQTNEDAAVDANGNSTLGLNAAINKLTNALNTLNLGDSQVAQFQATTQNRVDFNKNIVSLLNDAANNLTAADMSQVAAQTAALQVQQSFAQTILGNTKQSDQSILQLLR